MARISTGPSLSVTRIGFPHSSAPTNQSDSVCIDNWSNSSPSPAAKENTGYHLTSSPSGDDFTRSTGLLTAHSTQQELFRFAFRFTPSSSPPGPASPQSPPLQSWLSRSLNDFLFLDRNLDAADALTFGSEMQYKSEGQTIVLMMQ